MFRKRQDKYSGHAITVNHLLIVVLALLIGAQVYLSNRIATSGQVISELEQKAISLEEENRRLLSENVGFMSLHELSDKAKVMGYVEPKDILDLGHTNETLALQNNVHPGVE